MYTVILHVVFVKLFFELDRVTEIAILFVVVTILVFYGFMYIASGETLSRLLDSRLLNMTHQTFTSFVPFVIIYLGTFVAVFLDYTFKKIVNLLREIKGDKG